MAESTQQAPAFCLVLHDVAPATWRWYAEFIDAVDRLGNIPMTLLVVPDYHRQGAVDRFPTFVAAIDRRLAKGDEVVLHGYYHDDPGCCGRSPKDWFMRRIYTHEGEFYRLAESEAQRRLEQGSTLFDRLGWPLKGFVPPAWLLGDEARRALRHFPFTYTSSIRGLESLLPARNPVSAPTLVWSARSSWRRRMSRIWNDRLVQQQRNAPLLRLGLHPVDIQHASVRHYWLETLARMAEQRRPTTKSAWLEQST